MSASDHSCDVPIYTVDAFTDVPFGGNPAAVCLLPFDLVMIFQCKIKRVFHFIKKRRSLSCVNLITVNDVT